MSLPDASAEWQIVDIRHETPQTFTYTFSMDKKTEFSVGQFVTIGRYLKRPTPTGGIEESYEERAYSIASSPTRDKVDITVKSEKPYGYVNPKLKKADGFAAYFQEQAKIGDKLRIKFSPKKDHFLSRISSGKEKDIAYWSGANGAESARGLVQYMEDKPELGLHLILFYSIPHLYDDNGKIDAIYYDWLLEKAKRLENFQVVFTFTRDKETPTSDNSRIYFRTGRFFADANGMPEKTLTKYHDNPRTVFNPICGSSSFITGISMSTDGKLEKRKGIMQNLIEIEGISLERIDKEQFYLDQSH